MRDTVAVEFFLLWIRMVSILLNIDLFDKEPNEEKYKESVNLDSGLTMKQLIPTLSEDWVCQFDHLKHRHTLTGLDRKNMVYKGRDKADLTIKGSMWMRRYQLLKVKRNQIPGKKWHGIITHGPIITSNTIKLLKIKKLEVHNWKSLISFFVAEQCCPQTIFYSDYSFFLWTPRRLGWMSTE